MVSSELVFLAHIPLLRLERESLPFAGGDLWRMPFEHYDALTMGAFSGHQAKYEETAPVFYRVMGNLDLTILQPGQADSGTAIELKMASNDRNFFHKMGLSFLGNFHDMIVDRVWAALLLAAPAGAYPYLRLSMSAVVSTGDASFVFGQEKSICNVIRAQGDADQEYLFFAEAAGPPLTGEVVTRASSLWDIVDKVYQLDELNAALSSLLTTTSPSLSPHEQHTMSVIALEALLLPEVRSGLGSTFANRLSSLLASSPEHFATLQNLARQLYKSRSAAVHGMKPSSYLPAEESEYIHSAYAQQILASAIASLIDRVRPELTLDKLRIDLDKIPQMFNGSGTQLPLLNPPSLRRFEHLTRPLTSIAAALFFPGSAMHADDNTLLCWSPLVGLGIENPLSFGNQDCPIIMPVTGPEIVSLEEKDIRRDFIAQLHVSGKPVASLALGTNTPDPVDRDNVVRQLLRKRDLAVVALRLAGLSVFHDPELLGLYMYEGRLKYRHPTVFRQTLLTMLRVEPDEIIRAEDMKHILPTWQMLAAYDVTARHPEIDNVLTMFRRIFDSRFIPVEARAGLMLSTIEAMLGRFRPSDDPVQLEQLVANLVGTASETAIWFSNHGRKFRNSIAHGQWKGNHNVPDSVDHLVAILRAALPVFISAWLNLKERKDHWPSTILINRVSKIVGN